MDSKMCRDRATEDRLVAENSILAMEKQKFLVSAARWEALAVLCLKAETDHADRIAAQAASVAARREKAMA